jgi:hypothetical protein
MNGCIGSVLLCHDDDDDVVLVPVVVVVVDVVAVGISVAEHKSMQ